MIEDNPKQYDQPQQEDKKYNRLYIAISDTRGLPTITDMNEIVGIVFMDFGNDQFGESLDNPINREKIITMGYPELIYNFIKACASMREINGIEYYNVFGSWQKIIITKPSATNY